MAQNEIAAAARAICEEKGISLDAVIETIESALAAAYRKDFGEKNQNIKVEFDLDTGKSKVFDEKTVVEDMPDDVEDESDISATEEESKASETKNDKVESQKPAPSNDLGSKVESTTIADDDENKKIKSQESKVESTTTADDDEQKDEKTEKGASEESEDEEEVRRFNPRTEIQISDAKEIKKSYKVGDVIKTALDIPDEYGRMAAQTAKQVIIQRLREIERNNIYEEYKDKENEVITGVVQRREGKIVIVDLGKTAGIIPPDGQVPSERYESGQRIKVYVTAVNTTAKGPEILLSRSSEEIVRKIFYTEIPEISNGLIEIKAVSREAGSRSKISVMATEENVDPIGSCVGQRGARIQTIISELGGEKVDIIEYSEDPVEYISNALAPAKVLAVEVNEEERQAIATVAGDQLSLAIGKGGQNVRLAARLTGWKIDVKESSSKEQVAGGDSEEQVEEAEEKESKQTADDSKQKDDDANDNKEIASDKEQKDEDVEGGKSDEDKK